MEYSQGYVAFIDILGFSKYVSEERNGEKTEELFQFVEKFCYFYNNTPNLHTEVAFFSDSIVITSDEIASILATSLQISHVVKCCLSP